MEIQGELRIKLPLENGVSKAGKAWEKMGFVLQLEGSFPQQIAIDTFKSEWIQFINETSIGTILKCDINVSSKSWTGDNGKTRWFHNINLWKAEVMSGEGNVAVPKDIPMDNSGANDDLPF